MTAFLENVIEIAWIHQALLDRGVYGNAEFDSRDVRDEIVEIAKDFEEEYKGINFDESELDYYEEIDDFATERLMKFIG